MSDAQGLEEARQDLLGQFKTFASEMATEGPFFMGAEPTLIDFVVAPWAVRPAPNPALSALSTLTI